MVRRDAERLQVQLAIHPGPDDPVEKGQERTDLTHLDLAQPPVVLTPRTRTLRPRFLIGTLIQDQHPARAQLRRRRDLALHLLDRRLRQPGRVGHKLLQVLSILVGVYHPARNVGKVPVCVHSQQTSQIGPGVLTRIPRFGFEATAIARPEVSQTVAQVGDRLVRQSPAAGIKYIRANSLAGHEYHPPVLCVIRRVG